MVQIAGLIARRIVTFVNEGDSVGVGQRVAHPGVHSAGASAQGFLDKGAADSAISAGDQRHGAFDVHRFSSPLKSYLEALSAHRFMSSFEGSDSSTSFLAVAIPATGSPFGSSAPICTRTEAWSQ